MLTTEHHALLSTAFKAGKTAAKALRAREGSREYLPNPHAPTPGAMPKPGTLDAALFEAHDAGQCFGYCDLQSAARAMRRAYWHLSTALRTGRVRP